MTIKVNSIRWLNINRVRLIVGRKNPHLFPSALNVIDSVVWTSVQSSSASTHSLLGVLEKGQNWDLGAEVIRRSRRCFSFLGHQLVPLLGDLFTAPNWHFVFWQELWMPPRSTILRESMNTEARLKNNHDPWWAWHACPLMVCYIKSLPGIKQTS